MTISVLFFLTLTSSLMLPVNPWPVDGWFQTQYTLFGNFPGEMNYAPIAAPAVFLKVIHWFAALLGLGLKAEFYMGSVAQNLLLFLSACFVYWSCRKLTSPWLASFVAIIFLWFVLSTGLPQAFWSETVVIFLFSVLFFLAVKIYLDEFSTGGEFWRISVLCGLIIGALVLTRVTPILLIPCLALLFFGRLSRRRLFQYLSVVTIITAVFLVGTMAGNLARFGRFELTNSSGRHLWQGVKLIADRALDTSPEYQALKEYNGEMRGMNWWIIKIPNEMTHAFRFEKDPAEFAKEAILLSLAKEAIRTDPFLYLKHGIDNFIYTIGKTPERLGFDRSGNCYNPLNTDALLPPIAVSQFHLPPSFGKLSFEANRRLYQIFERLYPASLFFVLVSFWALFVRRIRLLPFLHGSAETTFSHMRYGTLVFFILSLPIIKLVNPQWADDRVTGLYIMLLVVQTFLVFKGAHKDGGPFTGHNRANGVIYSFCTLMFFGSLWFSWQIEYNNPRNVLPYLPFLSVMFAMALTFWIDLIRVSRVRPNK